MIEESYIKEIEEMLEPLVKDVTDEQVVAVTPFLEGFPHRDAIHLGKAIRPLIKLITQISILRGIAETGAEETENLGIQLTSILAKLLRKTYPGTEDMYFSITTDWEIYASVHNPEEIPKSGFAVH